MQDNYNITFSPPPSPSPLRATSPIPPNDMLNPAPDALSMARQSCSHLVESAEREPLSDEEKNNLESSGDEDSEHDSNKDFDQEVDLESDAEDEFLGERVEQELLEIGVFFAAKFEVVKLID